MLDRLVDAIWNLLKKEPPPPPPLKPKPAGEKKPRVQQVYKGRAKDLPEFTQGVEGAMLARVCTERLVCKYAPKIEQHRIYAVGRTTPEGDLEVEYEGIAGSCPPVKTFGLEVAQKHGFLQAYRYVDLNHLMDCCCGDPEQCIFYNKTIQEQEAVNKQLKSL